MSILQAALRAAPLLSPVGPHASPSPCKGSFQQQLERDALPVLRCPVLCLRCRLGLNFVATLEGGQPGIRVAPAECESLKVPLPS